MSNQGSSEPKLRPWTAEETWRGLYGRNVPCTDDRRVLLAQLGHDASGKDDAVNRRFKRKVSSLQVRLNGDRWEVTSERAPEVKTFEDDDSFLAFFSADTELMRSLLQQYTTKANEEPLTLGKKTSSDAVEKHFFERFAWNSFYIIPGDKSKPPQVRPGPSLRHNETIFAAKKQQTEKIFRAAKEDFEAARRVHNKAVEGKISQRQLEREHLIRAVDCCYKVILDKNAKECKSDEGDPNADLTRFSAEELIQFKMRKKFLREDSVIVDAGASYNVYLAHAAQVASCRAFGIEYVKTRARMAVSNYKTAMSDRRLLNHNVGYIWADLFGFTNFGNATILHMFDEAFPVRLLHHCIVCAFNTPTIEVICSFKASKARSLHRIFETYGFYLHDESVKVRKSGSGDGNTAYFYVRKSQDDAPVGCPAPLSFCLCPYKRKKADRALQEVQEAWNKDTRASYYQRLFERIDASTSRTRTQSLPCNCDHCRAQRRPECVLWLAMQYEDTLAENIAQVKIARINEELSVTAARDTVRCVACEQMNPGAAVHTVCTDKEENSCPRNDRHHKVDFTSKNFGRYIRGKLPHGQVFRQVSIDYMWMPNSYVYDRFKGKHGMTNLLESLRGLLPVDPDPIVGVVYLPFHADVLSMLWQSSGSWRRHYQWRWVSEDQAQENWLFAATQAVPNDDMVQLYGKEPNSHRLYCKVDRAQIEREVGTFFGLPDDVSRVRFLALKLSSGANNV